MAKKQRKFNFQNVLAATAGGGGALGLAVLAERHIPFAQQNPWVTPVAAEGLAQALVYFSKPDSFLKAAGYGMMGAVGADLAWMGVQKLQGGDDSVNGVSRITPMNGLPEYVAAMRRGVAKARRPMRRPIARRPGSNAPVIPQRRPGTPYVAVNRPAPRPGSRVKTVNPDFAKIMALADTMVPDDGTGTMM